MKSIAIVQQGQAVRSIAITQTPDKRRLESPERVYQTLFLESLQQIKSLRLAQPFKDVRIRSRTEGVQKSLLYVQKLFGVHTQSKAVAGVVAAGATFAADTGNSDNAGGKIQNFVEIFKGNHLAVVVPAKASLSKPEIDLPQPGGSLQAKLVSFFQIRHLAIADIPYEIFDEVASPQVRQQILRIVLCFEIPLFPFTMLVAELTHRLLYL